MKNQWDIFFKEKIKLIFQDKKNIIDIGGGLRAFKGRGNRQSRDREWIIPYIEKVDYKILDPVKDYNPDIVGDIHQLPFPESSCDAILCIAVLEHVENPWKACQEMHRVLKQGGYCFVYVPFLYYYHSHEGYYKDYWRFTKDSIDILFNNFPHKEVIGVRGAIATWLRISPLGKYKIIEFIGNILDRMLGKIKSNQTSGYYIFLKK